MSDTTAADLVEITADLLNAEAHNLANELMAKLEASLGNADLTAITSRLHDGINEGLEAAVSADFARVNDTAQAFYAEVAEAAVVGLHTAVDTVDALIALPYGLDILFGPVAHAIISTVEAILKPNAERLTKRAKALDDKADELDDKEDKWDARSAEALAEDRTNRARRFAKRADKRGNKADDLRARADRKEAKATALG